MPGGPTAQVLRQQSRRAVSKPLHILACGHLHRPTRNHHIVAQIAQRSAQQSEEQQTMRFGQSTLRCRLAVGPGQPPMRVVPDTASRKPATYSIFPVVPATPASVVSSKSSRADFSAIFLISENRTAFTFVQKNTQLKQTLPRLNFPIHSKKEFHRETIFAVPCCKFSARRHTLKPDPL